MFNTSSATIPASSHSSSSALSVTVPPPQVADTPPDDIPLTQFLQDFGDSLFAAVTAQNRPVYAGQTYPAHEAVMDGLARPLFAAQREVVRAVNHRCRRQALCE